MKKDIINVGNRIATIEGEIRIKSRHNGGSAAWCESYTYGWDEEADQPTGELAQEADRLLTMSEIAGLMKEVDGDNHDVTFGDRYVTRDREAGNVIDTFSDIIQARDAIEEYEEADKADGIYEEGFYEIYDRDNEEIVEARAPRTAPRIRDARNGISNLKAIRVEKDMTQRELADAAGVSYRTLQNLENGITDINDASAMTVWKLASALGCDVRDLLNF